ncbi:hypothetical protein QQF64_023557, partial [Cirrhinus molitorella]
WHEDQAWQTTLDWNKERVAYDTGLARGTRMAYDTGLARGTRMAYDTGLARGTRIANDNGMARGTRKVNNTALGKQLRAGSGKNKEASEKSVERKYLKEATVIV